ncbi:MAG TPA: Ig-like domain-containing protein [Mycobacteriales bacterium]|jgi:lipoprotein-anchoring transpeptidase ErfK/SrfK|nr:Ig-like domain-containing protein [Mycobacteriales bacterium]
MRLPQSRVTTVAAVAGVAVLVAVGVTVGVTAGHSSSGGSIAGSGEPPPPAALRVLHVRRNALPFSSKLTFKVTNGALTTVSVAEPDGQQIPGNFTADHAAWTSASSFAPLTKLKAAVSYADLVHHVTTRTFNIHSTDAKHRMLALLSPGGGDTVGIGSPIIATFNYDVPTKLRAAVEGRLAVRTSPHVVGAWHWMNAREVHWRPPSYWKPGTSVSVSADLQGLDFGHSIWGGSGLHSTSFRIGDAHVSEVDIATHEMHVYDNGTLIKTFPVSTGRDQYPTMDGVHIAIEKSPVVEMNSATVGILPGNPDYYDETVYWDVRISDGGEFVHAAPWSVSDQGHTNVSHGCVNLSTEDAEWFFNWANRGDIVDVFNGVRPPDPGDPGTEDWNMSWKQWVAGDAAASHAAKKLRVGLPSDYDPAYDAVSPTTTTPPKGKNSVGSQHGT